VINWFDKGNHLNLSFATSDKDKILLLYKVDGLHALVKKYFNQANESHTALLMEFVLHGLASYSLISKKIFESKIEFKDLIGSMMNMGTQTSYDEEFDEEA
jgi:magnesium chelatase subunit I